MEKPIQSFRAGAIQAAIFNNLRKVAGKDVEIPSVTVQKRYTKDGEWKSTNSFDLNDLPRAILVLAKSYDYVLSRKPAGGKLEDESFEEASVPE